LLLLLWAKHAGADEPNGGGLGRCGGRFDVSNAAIVDDGGFGAFDIVLGGDAGERFLAVGDDVVGFAQGSTLKPGDGLACAEGGDVSVGAFVSAEQSGVAIAHAAHGDHDVDLERAEEGVEAGGEPVSFEGALIEEVKMKGAGVGFVVEDTTLAKDDYMRFYSFRGKSVGDVKGLILGSTIAKVVLDEGDSHDSWAIEENQTGRAIFLGKCLVILRDEAYSVNLLGSLYLLRCKSW
jgi:hypothetical protein